MKIIQIKMPILLGISVFTLGLTNSLLPVTSSVMDKQKPIIKAISLRKISKDIKQIKMHKKRQLHSQIIQHYFNS